MDKDLTISIATRDRAKMLKRVLDGMLRGGELVCAVDVIIDSTEDHESVKVCEEMESELGTEFRWYALEAQGLALARNFGASICRTKFIRFHDDDDLITYANIEKLVQAHQLRPRDAIITHTRMDSRFSRPFMRFLTEEPGVVFNYSQMAQGVPLKFDSFWGGRTSLPVEVFSQLQFDPDFVFGCEDIEFGYRFLETDRCLYYEPEIFATQIRDISINQFIVRTFHQGFSQGLLAQKYPSGILNLWSQTGIVLESVDTISQLLNQISNLRREAERLDRPGENLNDIDESLVAYAKWIWISLYNSAKNLGFQCQKLKLDRFYVAEEKL